MSNIIKPIALAITLVLVAATAVPVAQAQAPQSEFVNRTVIYFTRHCEDVPELVQSDPSFSVTFNNCNADGSCCVEAHTGMILMSPRQLLLGTVKKFSAGTTQLKKVLTTDRHG